MSSLHLGSLNPETTVFMLCDIQEKFSSAITFFNEIVTTSQKLIAFSKIMSIPLIVTEQYPRGLGSTVKNLDVSHAVCIVPKTKFSMMVPAVEEMLNTQCSGAVKSVVLFGIEAHVCIEQTAIELLAKGIKVHIVADATSSRSQEDRLLAFQRLRQIGCFVTTSENVIFKLVKDKDHPKFNDIRGLVKDRSPHTMLVEQP